jgi:hypothetical protein
MCIKGDASQEGEFYQPALSCLETRLLEYDTNQLHLKPIRLLCFQSRDP